MTTRSSIIFHIYFCSPKKKKKICKEVDNGNRTERNLYLGNIYSPANEILGKARRKKYNSRIMFRGKKYQNLQTKVKKFKIKERRMGNRNCGKSIL